MHFSSRFIRFFSLFPLLLLPILLLAQPLSLSSTQLNFGNVFTGTRDSLSLTVGNPTGDTLNVTETRFYATYDSLTYSASDPQFILLPGVTRDLWVYFAPHHNIQHPSQMVLITDSGRGSVVVELAGQGKFSNTYYNATENLHEEALKTALKTRLGQGYQQLSYNAARDEMFMDIDNKRLNGQGATVNTLEGVYTGFTVTSYTNRTDAQLQGFNTEHTFPQGFFAQNLPMRSDIHHLFPTKEAANSERANLPFGTVANPTWQDGGSRSNGVVFEPRDGHKGAVARCMFYFVLRYQNYQNYLNSQEAVLRQWHRAFPPTAAEIRRNNDIFAVQNNRSPFVDYPQLLDRITSLSQASVAPQLPAIDLSEPLINYGTIFGNWDADYFFVIVNEGNQLLPLTDFLLGDPALSFVGGTGDNVILAPDAAHTVIVRINLPPQSSLNSTLRFNSGAAQGLVQVPVLAVSEGPSAVAELPVTALRLFPNPAAGSLQVEWELPGGIVPSAPLTLRMYDARGQVVLSESLPAGTRSARIDTAPLAAGRYVLSLESGGRAWVRKVGVANPR